MLCHDSAGNDSRKTPRGPITMTGSAAGSSHLRVLRISCRLTEMHPRVAPLPATCSQMPPSLMEGSGRFMSSGERPGTRLKLMATT